MTAAKELKRGEYVKISNEIFRVIRKEAVAYGTHSHSKTKLFVSGLKTKGEKSFNFNHTENVEVLDIMRKSAQVIAKNDDKLQIMDMHSYETMEALVDSELSSDINEGDEVTFIDVEGSIRVVDKRG